MLGKLKLHEQITLIALRDKEGTIAPNTNYTYALAGALLAELLLDGRVEIEGQKRRQKLALLDSTPYGDALLDQCLLKLREAKRQQAVSTWVSKFTGIKNIKHVSAQALVRRGILRVDQDKIMHLFTRTVFPEVNHQPEAELIDRLSHAIFTEEKDLDAGTVILISLAQATDMLKLIFDRKDLKMRKNRIKQICDGEVIGKAAKEAIEAMQAVIMVACIMPGVTAATVST